MKTIIVLVLSLFLIPAQAAVLTKTHCVIVATWAEVAVRLKTEGVTEEAALKTLAMDMATSEEHYRLPMAEVFAIGRSITTDLYNSSAVDSKAVGRGVMSDCMADLGKQFN